MNEWKWKLETWGVWILLGSGFWNLARARATARTGWKGGKSGLGSLWLVGAREGAGDFVLPEVLSAEPVSCCCLEPDGKQLE
ncbi:hypothetical protein CONLIGDRAFT_633321 [Coniochaeta ligniaria NRRL 30616]|uniref:Uncharacterized protein n=1 Tax=Coniochaeta ligniaria NRRL 30616 TaxID=1408157 RepID=A0A1J7IP58_9PEZI|nr:hypothetical protein CONLIGDRAFT_633321 [Coniochaeta ligniaria NRRL 30616]